MNAGVFAIPKKFRNNKSFEKLWELTTKYNNFMMFADQSAISLWCHFHRIHFSNDIRFNFQVSLFNYPIIFYSEVMKDINILIDIHILHFARCKPDTILFKTLLKVCHCFTDVANIHKLYED